MGYQDDYLLRNVQDTARLITKLLLGETMPAYTLPDKEPYTQADRLFQKIIELADQGDINEAENQLLENLVPDDKNYLELALTFYLHLNDMDADKLDEHDYSREEILDGIKSLAEDWGVIGLETLV